MSRLPLEGIRIADFTQIVQGPYGTLMLAQMGAEVIKIETETRATVNPQLPQQVAASNLNASKKSITLNLKDPRGVDVAKKLVKASDISVENFGSSVMGRFGLSYEDLRKVKPDIIHLSSQALGNTGPLKDAIGFFAEASNFAGVSDLTGYRDGRPGMVGAIWVDHLTGMLLAFLLMAALRHRNRTGEGQYIQLSMAENLIASIPEATLDYSISGREQTRQENMDMAMSPHNVYRCQDFDKWVSIAVTNEEEWHSLCLAMGHTEWMDDERFANPLSRWHNQEELDKLITQWTIQRTDREAMHMLQEAGVAAGPIYDAEGLATDPHLNERGCFVPLGEVEGVPYVHLAHPWRLSDSAAPYYAIAPTLGQHTEEVMVNILGMSKEEVAELTKDKVLS